ncbi:hypothetical protein BFP72_06815 [Reichenbachiella sp. 5M10]|uniref:hypothetical protein n=1 Tax=Reichenbachiella sp. 5M10 TaxID=1889772 RepID=UPI000C155D8C|nr:hypothetical protein [Reichenbachiella sp. 5M10]PIB35126.1 hypothetical protein BFP72_06815 [Reichenbachiella sp. 5M10]
MKRNHISIYAVILYLLATLPTLSAQDATRIGQVSLVPGFSTSRGPSAEQTNLVSLNLLAGNEYALKGAELASLLNINQQNVVGAQLAGLSNYTGGQTTGAQIAGLSNINHAGIVGTQVAGLSNWIEGSVRGLQLSGLLNYNTEAVQGMQLTGLVNVSQTSQGMQLAGLHNHSLRTQGVQLAGLSNQSNALQGTQISGLVNLSEETKGLQLSALYNQTNHLRGLQFGLINIADSVCSGTQFGLINIVKKNGLFAFGVEYGDVTPWNVNLRTGTHRFYSILTTGTQFEEAQGDEIWSYGVGFGSQFRLKDRLLANIELVSSQLRKHEDHVEALYLLNRFHVNIGYQILKHLTVTGGPVLNIYVAQTDKSPTDQPTIDIAHKPFYEQQEGNYKIQAWVGYSFGIRF